jgi:ketosteroid isomerase-like protein
MKSVALLYGFVSLFAAACSSEPKVLPPETTSSFEKAFGKDNPDAAAALFTEDAEILTQERPVVRGREEIREFLGQQMTPVMLYDANSEWNIVRDDIAFEEGSYRVRDVRRGSDIETGKYMHLWKNVNGEWKLHRVMYNTDEPLSGSVSVATDDSGEPD